MRKRWKVSPPQKDLQDRLVRDLGILPLTARILVNRGLVDCDRASCFLSPSLRHLHDPFLMRDMDRAVERVCRALARGERMAVYGDYDVDGTSGAALLHLFFRALGAETAVYIPEREAEGYGLNAGALARLHAEGVRLVITVDCGTSDHEAIGFASSLGMDVIVTDHHEPMPGPLPAHAFVNPRRQGCAFPFKGLAGVGVAFNLAMALRSRLRQRGALRDGGPNLKRFLDLVAIGTVTDMVPLVDENRVLVHYGLEELACTTRPGLIALKEAAGLGPGPVEAHHVAFKIGPRLNAAGRVSSAGRALRLLVTEDGAEAASLAGELEEANRARRAIENEILEEALSMASSAPPGARALVLASEGWHQGVIGIVASRLTERFAVPVVMIAVDGDRCRGSARGVRAFDMLEGIRRCSALLERFGGHRAAAGFSLDRACLEAFREEFLGYAGEALTDEDLVPEVEIDARVRLREMDLRAVAEIERLAPFGVANREPLLCLPDTTLVDTAVVGGGRHLRFMFSQDGETARGIGFGLAGLEGLGGGGYSLAFSPYTDRWGGTARPGFRIRDVSRTSEVLCRG